MKVEAIHGGKYRIRKMYKGKTYTVIFDHLPTEKEKAIAIAEVLENETCKHNGSFDSVAQEYIDSRKGVASPSTIRTYTIKLNQISADFKLLNIREISNTDVQKEIKRLAAKLEPKTVKTTYGFISSVLGVYRPNLRLKVTLPQVIKKNPYEPNNEDIRRLLDRAKGTQFSVPFQHKTLTTLPLKVRAVLSPR